MAKKLKLNEWYSLPCRKQDLQLLGTLNGGQSFRWKKETANELTERWTGIFDSKVWILEQQEHEILYKVYESCENDRNRVQRNLFYNELLMKYFQLHLNLDEYYKQWSEADPIFAKASTRFYGIRILKQNVTENIFSFICSSNNNISRITSMVNKLAEFYGKKICEIDGQSYYTFPKVEILAEDKVEKKLRDNGFGYRAKYICETAKIIKERGGDTWLDSLEKLDYLEAKASLMTLMGIGAKVADCICLMSLGHLEALPVDTHVYQIALKFYLPHLSKKKTVTDKIYNEIGDHFRKLYGPLAGWAHTILFCADLKKFQT